MLSPVMTSLSERLRVKYRESDDVDKQSSKRDHRGGHRRNFKIPGSTKLFHNKSSSDVSETQGCVTDSGIYSTADMSEVTLNVNADSVPSRGQQSSPAPGKSHESPTNRRKYTDISKAKFYKSGKDKHPAMNFVSKGGSPSSKTSPSGDEFTLPFPRNNQRARSNRSPAASEIVTTGLARSRYQRERGDLTIDNANEAGARVVRPKFHQSVPAKESSICEGRGKCTKPVCFVCIM